jgi:4-amino-4-deoxy-L-arabinose transferase-like glycosyltransferase
MRILFWALWAALLLIKLLLAAAVPLFVDEGFYWQEGRHLAWAYSDLPGLTAWLVWLGESVGGTSLLAIRAPFLVIGALVPLLVVAIARRLAAAPLAWLAGALALLLPLGGSLGLFALPDVPLVLAGLLCVLAVSRLLAQRDRVGFALLALGLVLGGLAHYRFLGTLGAGLLALLLVPAGRALLRDWRCWLAIAAGALAWWPVLAWNRAHASAGWRFQLLERHPWELHGDGWLFLLAQPLLVTPLLFAAIVLGIVHGLRRVSALADDAHPIGCALGAPERERVRPRRTLSGMEPDDPAAAAATHWLAAFAGISLVGLFLLGFVADAQRISFHWPLTAALAALPLAALVLRGWAGWLRGLAMLLAALGLAALLAYCAALAGAHGQAPAPAAKWYPSNFAGWEELAAAVREEQSAMPPGTRVVAGDFKIGAQLGFALRDPSIPVLPHAANRHHGRDEQLALWGLRVADRDALGEGAWLLVVDPSSVKPRERADYARALCEWGRALPPPRQVVVDGGRRSFLLFALKPVVERDVCVGAGPLPAS